MTAAFTILLPHKRNPGNDAALRIALDMLFANTVHDFHLLIDAATDAPLYPRINALFERATTDCCIYWSSDMFPVKAWDQPMLEAWDARTIVTNVLVEPGAIGVHHMNLHRDFGRTPVTFQREAFEAWAANEAPMLEGEGWLAPYAISRQSFLDMGGLMTGTEGIPVDPQGFTGADEAFFAKWKAAGNRIIRARSYAYHLQRWSEPFEQHKGERA